MDHCLISGPSIPEAEKAWPAVRSVLGGHRQRIAICLRPRAAVDQPQQWLADPREPPEDKPGRGSRPDTDRNFVSVPAKRLSECAYVDTAGRQNILHLDIRGTGPVIGNRRI